VLLEVASGTKTDWAWLRRLAKQLAPGDLLMVTRARPAGQTQLRPVKDSRGDHRQNASKNRWQFVR